MAKDNYNDLAAFMAVATELSFTRAAARMNVSPSALSHTIRNLESRLSMRLFTRTTRAVALTEAGIRLHSGLSPLMDAIDEELDALNTLRDKPAGTIRLSAPEFAARFYLWPKITQFISEYPDVTVEMNVSNSLLDIVSENFDAGIRMGENLAKDMISVRISPDTRYLVVGAPAYLDTITIPEHPRDLFQCKCINYRFSLAGQIVPWEFARNGKIVKVRVEGPLVFNDVEHALKAAQEGVGLAYVHEEYAREYIQNGTLQELLTDWSPHCEGLHLYYPNRHHTSSAFTAFIETLRFRV